MKAEIKIPKGFRRLRRGETFLKGDWYFWFPCTWHLVRQRIGDKNDFDGPVIRPLAAKPSIRKSIGRKGRG